jgi:hypothetical protein
MSTATAIDPKANVLPLLEGSTWPNATEALAQAHAAHPHHQDRGVEIHPRGQAVQPALCRAQG